MKKYFTVAKALVFALGLGSTAMQAQVGMTSNNPDKSAALDMKAASNKGLLIPNVNLSSTIDQSSIAGGTPAQSLLVYNTNSSITGTGAAGAGYYYWDTNIWKKLATKADVPVGTTATMTSPNSTIAVSGSNNVLSATTVDIVPGTNGQVMTTNAAGKVVWSAPAAATGTTMTSPNSTVVLSGTNNVLTATSVDIKPGTSGQLMTTNAAGKVVWSAPSALTAAAITSPNSTIVVSGANNVLSATTVDIKPGSIAQVLTTNDSGQVAWGSQNQMTGGISFIAQNGLGGGNNPLPVGVNTDIAFGGNITVGVNRPSRIVISGRVSIGLSAADASGAGVIKITNGATGSIINAFTGSVGYSIANSGSGSEVMFATVPFEASVTVTTAGTYTFVIYAQPTWTKSSTGTLLTGTAAQHRLNVGPGGTHSSYRITVYNE